MHQPRRPPHPFALSCVFACALSACANRPPASVADTAAANVDAAPVDAAADAAATAPKSPEARGFEWRRTVVHIHSAYSHDACDGEIDKTNVANPTCLGQLRAALCASGLDVGFLTDHPSHMKSYGFKELLLFDAKAGDTLVGPADAPWANVVQCAALPGQPAHDVVLTVGYEATHTMPVGLYRHYTVTEFEGQTIADEAPFAKARAAVDHAHAVSAVVVNAHSEEDDISAARLVASGVDAMEIYNMHANFKTLTGQGSKKGKGAIARVFDLEHFLGPKDTSPVADLVPLVMLDVQPEQAFLKWQAVLGQRHVTGLLGSDVHQNVVLEPWCAAGGMLEGVCDGFQDAYPKLAKLLTEGGQVILADGKRIDDYTRVLRWLSDRVLVPAGTPPTARAQAVKDALVQGRAWAVFDVLGEPDGVDFCAQEGSKVTEMGGTVALGATLHLRLPQAVVPAPWAPWTPADAQKPGDEPTLRTLVWFIAPGAETAEVVHEVEGFGHDVTLTPQKPGRYHPELRLVPRQLRSHLKALGKFADKEQRWVVGNAIRVQ